MDVKRDLVGEGLEALDVTRTLPHHRKRDTLRPCGLIDGPS